MEIRLLSGFLRQGPTKAREGETPPFFSMWICLYIGFILTTCIFYPFLTGNALADTQYFYTPKEFMFVITSFLVTAFAGFYSDDYGLKFKNKWISAFLIFFVMQFMWNFMAPVIFGSGDKHSVWTLWAIRPFLCFISAYLLMTTLIQSGIDIKPWVNLCKVFAGVCIVLSVLAVVQWLGIDSIINSHYGRNFHNGIFERSQLITTFMGERTMSSACIAILSPYLLMFKGFKYKALYLLAFLAIVMAESTISLIAFFIGLFVYLLMKKNKKGILWMVLIAFITLIFMSCFYKSFWNFNGRILLWKDVVLNIFHSNALLFGKGFGSFAHSFNIHSKLVTPEYNLIILFAHNEFVQMLSEGGLLTVVLFSGYILNLFLRIAKQWTFDRSILLICNIAAISAVLVIAQGLFPFWFAPTAFMAILILSSTEFILIRSNRNG